MATLDLPRAAGAPPLPSRPAERSRRRWGWGAAALILLGLLIYGWTNVGGSVTDLWNGFFGHKGLRSIIPQAVPPASSAIVEGLKASVTTFCVAVLSIVFGILWAIAMLPWAARNLAPDPVSYGIARTIQAVLRAIPELVMLLIFVICVGISPFSAVIALSFHGIGVMGKLFAEAVEEMDMGPVEALRVAGAGRIQVFLHAVLPGVWSTLLGLTLYRLDANFRSAVTLGAVGGGGIGFLITNQLNTFVFKAVATYLIIMILWVLVIERVSAMLRARL